MALTSGFTYGRMVPEWSCLSFQNGRCAAPAQPPAPWPARAPAHGPPPSRCCRPHRRAAVPRSLRWQPVRLDTGPVYGAERVTDGIVRIDCAVVDVGGGRFVIAGGCRDHPNRAHASGGFFRSAFTYDALTHTATPLPDMPCRRHGCGGACIDGKVYIVGGEYVSAQGPGKAACSVLDLGTGSWSTLDAPLPSSGPLPAAARPAAPSGPVHLMPPDLQGQQAWSLADDSSPFLHSGWNTFIPVGAVAGRLVIVVGGWLVLAYNPAQPEDGWCQSVRAAADECVEIGTSSQESVEWSGHLVVASGRGPRSAACAIFAFSFTGLRDEPHIVVDERTCPRRAHLASVTQRRKRDGRPRARRRRHRSKEPVAPFPTHACASLRRRHILIAPFAQRVRMPPPQTATRGTTRSLGPRGGGRVSGRRARRGALAAVLPLCTTGSTCLEALTSPSESVFMVSTAALRAGAVHSQSCRRRSIVRLPTRYELVSGASKRATPAARRS